jgi:hypothetical protein
MLSLTVMGALLTTFPASAQVNTSLDTSQVKVVSYTWYTAPENTYQAAYIGDMVAVGEIQNTGSNVLGFVILAANAYDESGQTLASTQGRVLVANMQPGQKAPFYLDFIPDYSTTQDNSWIPSMANISISVIHVEPATGTQYAGLVIPTGSTTPYRDSSGTYTVTGTIRNTGSETVGTVWAVTTFYNSSGTVVAINYTTYLTHSCPPGTSLPFTASPMDNSAQLSNQIVNYSVLIQSEPLDTSTTASPSTGSSPQTTTSPTPTKSAQATQPPTSGNSSWLIYVAAVVAVIVVVIAVGIVMRRRQRPRYRRRR